MPKKLLSRASAVLLTALVMACGANQPPVGPIPAGLTGISWRLVTLGPTSGAPNGGGPDLTLQLNSGRTASGFTGCNRFHASFMQNGDTLRFGPLVTTRVGCPGNFTFEQRYLAALTATNRFEVNTDSLVLYQGPTAGLVFKH